MCELFHIYEIFVNLRKLRNKQNFIYKRLKILLKGIGKRGLGNFGIENIDCPISQFQNYFK